MYKSNETDSRLNFTEKPNPAKTHNNWLADKLHQMTMASEMRIKGEVMTPDSDGEISKMIGAYILGVTANFLDWKGESSWTLTMNVVSENYKMDFLAYVALVATYTHSITQPYIDYLRNYQRVESSRKKTGELLTRTDTPKDLHEK